jgi:serine/threonine-protein kinase
MSLERLRAALADRYSLERELGAGGMATVYLAQDLKHKRKVAIKVLRPELGAVIGADRFLTEITTTANLQHPHILGLIDSGDAGGLLWYAMPYVDGESLRDRLDREKQLPIADAVRIATEVAGALDYAHRHGVIHRDIKPENILLHDGSALVADFGIALAASTAGSRMTETGMSLGTPHYMSPEQAMGERELDARSDVYALGCVTYEMLTGEPPFTGPTAQAIVAKVMTAEPAIATSVRTTIPANVAGAVHVALQKLPADRFASAKAFAEALGNPAFTVASTGGIGAGHAAAGGVSRQLFAVTAALLLVASAAAAAGWLRSDPPQPVRRYTMAFPPEQSLVVGLGNGTSFALSPDGSKLVYTGLAGQERLLWLRDRSQLAGRPIPGTEAGLSPSFSPSGDRLAFSTADTRLLKVVDLAGTAPITIAEPGAGVDGLTWATDGYIYYEAPTLGTTVGLKRIRPEGGTGELVTTVDVAAGEADHTNPQALPDGRGLLFTIRYRDRRRVADSIAAFDFGSKTWHALLAGKTARYAASGHLVYVTGSGDLMAAPFNLKTLTVSGAVRTVASGVRVGQFGNVPITLSDNGTLMYARDDAAPELSDIVYVTRTGAVEVIDSTWSARFRSLALSPDGKRLAVSIVEGNEQQVWVKQLPDGFPERVSFEGTANTNPRWHPDGRTLGYLSNRASKVEFWSSTPGAATTETLQLALPGQDVTEAFWSPDGAWIIYNVGATTQGDIFARRVNSDSMITLLDSQVVEVQPALSPDGRWLAFMTAGAESPQVLVRPFPETQSRVWAVSATGGSRPVWSHSGRELLYSQGLGLVSLEVLPGESFREGRRTTLPFMSPYRQWDLTPDDARFIAIRPGRQTAAADQLVVVENLFAELGDR